MKLHRSIAPLLIAVLLAAVAQGCAAQHYADETYQTAGAKFAAANSDDIARWIQNNTGSTERINLQNALAIWRTSPGDPATDQAFVDQVGGRLEGWARGDTTFTELERKAIVADIKSWLTLVASRRG